LLIDGLPAAVSEYLGREVAADDWEAIEDFLQNDCNEVGAILHCYAYQLLWEHHAGEDGVPLPMEPFVAFVEMTTGYPIRWPEGVTIPPYWPVGA
jgi:hypothetical protein